MVGRRVLAAAVLAAALASPVRASAQPGPPPGDAEEPPSGDADGARARTRALANEGLRAYRKGDYVTALAKFEQAEAIVPAPTIALHRARSLEKLGRMAEALERYRAITEAPPAADAPYVHHRAFQDAKLELEALEPRVPVVTFIVDGSPGEGAELSIDGRAVPWPGRSDRLVWRVDPGSRRFELRRRDGTRAAAGAELAERSRTDVQLSLPPPRPGGGAGDEELPEETSGGGGGLLPLDRQTQQTAGWIAVAAGGLGLGVALVTGGAAIAVGGDLSDRCPGDVCPPEAHGDVDTHDAFRTTSTIGFIAAGVFGAAGAFLLLTLPEEEVGTSAGRAPAGRASARVGPQGVSVSVSY